MEEQKNTTNAPVNTDDEKMALSKAVRAVKTKDDLAKALADINKSQLSELSKCILRGMAYYFAKERKDAQTHFEACLKLDPPKKFLSLLYDWLGCCALAMNQPEQAVVHFRDALEKTQSRAAFNNTCLNAATCQINFLKNYGRGLDFAATALAIKESLKGWELKGDAYFGLGDYNCAKFCYERALKMAISDKQTKSQLSSLWLAKGNCHFFLEEWETAIAHFDKTMSLEPEIGAYGLLVLKAGCYYMLEKNKQAIACLDEYLSANQGIPQDVFIVQLALKLKLLCLRALGDNPK